MNIELLANSKIIRSNTMEWGDTGLIYDDASYINAPVIMGDFGVLICIDTGDTFPKGHDLAIIQAEFKIVQTK